MGNWVENFSGNDFMFWKEAMRVGKGESVKKLCVKDIEGKLMTEKRRKKLLLYR